MLSLKLKKILCSVFIKNSTIRNKLKQNKKLKNRRTSVVPPNSIELDINFEIKTPPPHYIYFKSHHKQKVS